MRLDLHSRNRVWCRPAPAFRAYWVIILFGMVQTFACSISIPGEFLDRVPAPEITSFSINGAPAVIQGDAINLDLRWNGDLNNLVAFFNHTGKDVRVGGIRQTSGVTPNRFVIPQIYVVTGVDGSSRNYSVNILGGFPFPDSGQAQCSSGANADGAMAACPQTITGQDGDYADLPKARSYTGPTQHAVFVNDYTTKDNATNLTWKSCSEGLSGPMCASGTLGSYTLSPDTTTCSDLNLANSGKGYAGMKNWRLPTIEELRTLANFFLAGPTIDTANFPATQSAQYWSSTATSGTFAFFANFIDRNSMSQPKTGSSHVRCVASPSVAYTPAYIDNNDYTVTTANTNLRWQRCSAGQNNDTTCTGSAITATWLAALSYCQGLSLAGLTWRLPSQNELVSLAQINAGSPAINANYFPSTVSGLYWSSTTRPTSTTNAYRVSFSDGSTNTLLKTNAYYVRCVSGL